MYQLTAKTGGLKGSSWTIGEQPLIIGRDITCDITVNDPLVSRRHCELRREGSEVYLIDLGSSNATFVNATPVKEAELRLGDEIAVGNAIFFVTQLRPAADPAAGGDAPAATHGLRIGEPMYLQEDGDSLFAHGKPRTAEDLATLFNIGRALSQSGTTEGLITMLTQRLEERFDPESLWVALCREGGEDLLIYPPEEASAITADRPLHGIVWRAIREPNGILLPERWSHAGQVGIRTTMVAPIALAREPVGALIVQADTPRRLYDENDLEFLLAIAHAAAPYLKAVERLEHLERENERLLAGAPHSTPIIGTGKAVSRMRSLARQCARADLNVLILGETGTGKELVARLIHDLSQRAGKPLTIVNCAAIPDELFESEVFGHERGAFTGAHAAKTGLFEECNGGTLFLDEVGDTSLHNQARLLRAIETGTFRRVGGKTDIHVKVRVISATNRNLASEVEAGHFRRDLYHRLNAFEIHIPPLRERQADIPELAEHFLRQAQPRAGGTLADGFEPEALQALREYPWPGNVRELRNVIERAVVVARYRLIRREDLVLAPGAPRTNGKEPFPTLEEIERRHIVRALEESEGNMKTAADLLGIGRSTLYRKVAEYGLA